MDVYLPQLSKSIIYFFQHYVFLPQLKLSEVAPLYEELDPLHNENHRPVSLLSQIYRHSETNCQLRER